jgi:hypothetical protein
MIRQNTEEILIEAKSVTSKEQLFDSLCYLANSLDEDKATQNDKLKIFQKGFEIFDNNSFIEHFKILLNYHRKLSDDVDDRSFPASLINSAQFINTSLYYAFYIVADAATNFGVDGIEQIEKHFQKTINNLEHKLLNEFSVLEILHLLEETNFNAKYSFKKTYPLKFSDKNFYKTLTKARLLCGNYIVDLYFPILLSKRLTKIKLAKENSENEYNVTYAVNDLYRIVHRNEALKKGLSIEARNPNFTVAMLDIKKFLVFFESKDAAKILYLLKLVIKDLELSEDRTIRFGDKILNKIQSAESIRKEIESYLMNNFSFFPQYKGPADVKHWSYKSFLNTIKFLALLEVINKSTNSTWKISTFIKYFFDWVDDVYINVNYFVGVDDYDALRKLIKDGETDTIEFKSTLGLLTEKTHTKEHAIKARQEIVEKICHTILAMANTNGGNIIIGVIEKPDKIIDDEIKSKIFRKEGWSFLDIEYSLMRDSETLDSRRRAIQDYLKNATDERIDLLDSLFRFSILKIYTGSNDRFIALLNIEVKKHDKKVYLRRLEGGNIWITLPKRLNGRVELVNPAADV